MQLHIFIDCKTFTIWCHKIWNDQENYVMNLSMTSWKPSRCLWCTFKFLWLQKCRIMQYGSYNLFSENDDKRYVYCSILNFSRNGIKSRATSSNSHNISAFIFQVETMINPNRPGCLQARYTTDTDLPMDFALTSKFWQHFSFCGRIQNQIMYL